MLKHLQFLPVILFTLVILLFPIKIHAAVIIPPGGGGGIDLPESTTKKFTETGLVGQIISSFLPIILGIAGFVTVIIIVISGIQFVTSGGNPEAAAAARGRLTFAIIGFVIIILAFAILQIVNRIFLGTKVV